MIADLTEAIRLDPEYARAYYNRGFAYEEKGDQAKAKADFAKAKELGYRPE
jgi:Flp pilus assembly protein TadD